MLILDQVHIRRGTTHLMADLTCEAPMTGLVGPSGCGKTTLLHTIAGLLRPTTGRIEVAGTVVFDTYNAVELPPHQRGIGLVFQDVRLFPHLDVEGNLKYAAAAHQRGEDLQTAPGSSFYDEVVGILELNTCLARRPRSLSGGEARRVAIGRMLLSRPRILLLDEPLAGLDGPLAERIIGYIRRIQQHFSIPALLCSHDRAVIRGVTDEIVTFEQGILKRLA